MGGIATGTVTAESVAQHHRPHHRHPPHQRYATTRNASQGGHSALFTFTGTAGQRVTAEVTGVGTGTASLVAPNGSVLHVGDQRRAHRQRRRTPRRWHLHHRSGTARHHRRHRHRQSMEHRNRDPCRQPRQRQPGQRSKQRRWTRCRGHLHRHSRHPNHRRRQRHHRVRDPSHPTRHQRQRNHLVIVAYKPEPLSPQV